MNVFTAIGRIGRDAVTRYTQGGKAVTGWALAVDSGWGENKTTTWLDCAILGERGEKLAEHIRKGDRLGVSGEIGTREHDGKTYVTLKVADVTLLGYKRQESTGGGTSGSRGGAPQRQAPAAQQPRQEFIDDDLDGIPF